MNSYQVTASNERVSASSTRSLLSVSVDSQCFSMDTEHVRAFFDISHNRHLVEQAIAEHGMAGQVESLSVLLQDCSIRYSGEDREDREKALITVETANFSGGLLVDSVSRPKDIPSENFHKLPTLCRIATNRQLFREVAFDSNPNQNSDRLTLVLDPLAALGYEDHIPDTETQNFGFSKSEQVLVFLPETNLNLSSVEYLFCLPLTEVVEVLSTNEFHCLPYKSKYCEGYIVLRDRPIPVIALGKIFGMESVPRFIDRRSRTRNKRLIIARAGSQWMAFCVNNQVQTLHSPAATLLNEFSLPEHAPTLGVFETEMGRLVVPDLNRILNSEFENSEFLTAQVSPAT